jgi:hypothetical protein
MQDAMTEEGFLDSVVFSDYSTFHISGKVYRHKVRIWGTENPHEIVQHEKASPKIKVFLRNVHTNGIWAFLFLLRHCDGNKLSGNVRDMAVP